MKTILFITVNSIFPLNNGASHYTFSIVSKLISTGFKITLIEIKNKAVNNSESSSFYKKYFVDYHQFILPKVKSFNFFRPITINKYYSKKILTSRFIKQKYDYYFFDHLHSAFLTELLLFPKNNTFLIEHNIEQSVWKSYLKVSSLMLKPLIYFQYLLMKNYESRVLNRFHNIIFISENDLLFTSLKLNITNRNKFLVLPTTNLDRTHFGNIKNQQIKNLCFFGSYSWFPNVEAANFLIFQMMPEIRFRKLNYKLLLIGANPTPEMIQQAKLNDDILVLGKVNSIEESLSNCDIFINSIFSGGGMNIKLIDALSLGMPTISSKFGIRGFSKLSEIIPTFSNVKQLVDLIESFNSFESRQNYSKLLKNFYTTHFINNNNQLEDYLLD